MARIPEQSYQKSHLSLAKKCENNQNICCWKQSKKKLQKQNLCDEKRCKIWLDLTFLYIYNKVNYGLLNEVVIKRSKIKDKTIENLITTTTMLHFAGCQNKNLSNDWMLETRTACCNLVETFFAQPELPSQFFWANQQLPVAIQCRKCFCFFLALFWDSSKFHKI